MITSQCSQCQLDTGGNHEWNCPFNIDRTAPEEKIVEPKECQHNFRLASYNREANGAIEWQDYCYVCCVNCGKVRKVLVEK